MDQHLHRHVHELIPAAQMLLAPEEVAAATRAFVRAKTNALRSRRRGAVARGMSSEFALIATLALADRLLAGGEEDCGQGVARKMTGKIGASVFRGIIVKVSLPLVQALLSGLSATQHLHSQPIISSVQG